MFPKLSSPPGEMGFFHYGRPFFISLLPSWAGPQKSVKCPRPLPCILQESRLETLLKVGVHAGPRACDPWSDAHLQRHLPQKTWSPPFGISSPFVLAFCMMFISLESPSCLFQELQQSPLAWPTYCFDVLGVLQLSLTQYVLKPVLEIIIARN